MATATTAIIKQGDAYAIPVTLKIGGDTVTANNLSLIDKVEFMIGANIRKVYPTDATFADGKFQVPVTQAETFTLPEDDEVEFDVRVHFTSGNVQGIQKKLKIKVVDAISEVVL